MRIIWIIIFFFLFFIKYSQQQQNASNNFSPSLVDYKNKEIFEEEIELDDDDDDQDVCDKEEDNLTAQSNSCADEAAQFSDNTIKTVVDKCFSQIAKNNKIKSPCIYVKHNHNRKTTTTTAATTEKNYSEVTTSHLANLPSSSQIKLVSVNPVSSASNREAFMPPASSTSSVCSSDSSSFDNNPGLRQTVVEKASDLVNAPTNTILLSGGGDEPTQDIYSLKITFV